MLRPENTENIMDKSSQSQQEKVAEAFLNSHAEELKNKFSTSEDLQDFFADVFGNNLASSEDLVSLRDKFANGTLRPEVKFVSPQVLTDAQGRTRDAAFERESQTILLSENLDAAAIGTSIQQELGHWWDVQLNETKDTTTAKGKPFDEGTAYAERFGEGANGDNIFSGQVYQNDLHTVSLDGRETAVEFRPIATWNINGNSNSGNNTWNAVFNVMENPGQGQNAIEIMGIQEAGRTNGGRDGIGARLESVTGVENFTTEEPLTGTDQNGNPLNVLEFNFERNNVPYRVYWTNSGINELGLAMVLRNPPDNTSPIFISNPRNPNNSRGILGVETDGKYYFTVHAGSGRGLNTGNDAVDLIEAIETNNNLNQDQPLYILGDFNRDIAALNNPVIGNVLNAFPQNGQLVNDQFAPPNERTFNARVSQGERASTLDYMFTPEAQELQNRQGVVLSQLPNAGTGQFPSDHLPVVYDDTLEERGSVTPMEVDVQFSSIDTQGNLSEFDPNNLNRNVPTYFITHGLRLNASTTAGNLEAWQKEAGISISQQQGNVNVILVSWAAPVFNPTFSPFRVPSLSLTNYEQAAANTKTVGNKIADFIDTNNIIPQNTTLIGHSLGAQASGWAGSILRNSSANKIGNIVGLDPARPSFEDVVQVPSIEIPLGNYLSPDRLDASDAERVSVIHTSRYFGVRNPISNGDNRNALDIYVNGGNSGNSSEIREFFSDAHGYAYEFFQDLLDGKGFNQDRETEGFKNLSELNNPTNSGGEVPLVSLNTILQGNGDPQGINRGKIDIQRSESATLPETLNFDGTEQADNLAGTQTTNEIKGGAGDDLISGLGGNDRLSGEEGNDTLFAGVDNDTLFGGVGNDNLFGGDGEDILIGVNPEVANPGSGQSDTLTGGGAKDTFVLGDENTNFYVGNEFIPPTEIVNFEPEKDVIQVNNKDNIRVENFFDSFTQQQGTKIYLGTAPVEFSGVPILIENVSAVDVDASIIEA